MAKDGKFVIRCKDGDGEEVARGSCDMQVRAGGSSSSYGASAGSKANSRIVANKTNVTAGETVTIAWRGNGTDNCTITGPDGFKEYGNKGSVTGRMLQTSIFQLSCSVGNRQLPLEEITIVTI